MFAVLYRWRVRPGATEQFRDAWRRGTIAIQERFKSGGSRLHRAADGTWIALVQEVKRLLDDGPCQLDFTIPLSRAMLQGLEGPNRYAELSSFLQVRNRPREALLDAAQHLRG